MKDSNPTSPTTTYEADIDTLSRAIQELDDLTYHQPHGIAMLAQEALTRLADVVRSVANGQ